jgi:hypothetical protein
MKHIDGSFYSRADYERELELRLRMNEKMQHDILELRPHMVGKPERTKAFPKPIKEEQVLSRHTLENLKLLVTNPKKWVKKFV